jgi:hypothetical protein
MRPSQNSSLINTSERFGKNQPNCWKLQLEPKKLPNRTDWSFVYADTPAIRWPKDRRA